MCRSEDDQEVTVNTLGEKALARAGKHWRYMMSDEEKKLQRIEDIKELLS